MFGAYMLMTEAFRFFGGHVKDALAFGAERNLDGGGDALANGDARFDFFANRFD
jgi:hypothetical protein